MVGTAPDVRGGISTIVRGYVEGGLFERYAAKYVVTHRDGSGLRKARVAVAAYLKFAGLMLTSRAPAAHPSGLARVVLAQVAHLRDGG